MADRGQPADAGRPDAAGGLPYTPVGGSASGVPQPGFDWIRVRTRVGIAADFDRAARAVLEWRMHRAMAGVALAPGAPRARPGTDVVVALGAGALRVRGRCRVVWSEHGPERAGFGYGTLPGHPLRGEEAFVVARGPDGSLWLEVYAYSLPAARWTRAARPLVRLLQRAYARECGRALRKLLRNG